MEQIEREGYVNQLYLNGMKKVIKCGISCYMKDCKTVFEQQ